MNYESEVLTARLWATRKEKGLSQRELSRLTGVPQSHISKIEANQVDLRVSSLVAIANALDLELFLVPRKAAAAVRAITQQPRTEPGPAYTLDQDEL